MRKHGCMHRPLSAKPWRWPKRRVWAMDPFKPAWLSSKRVLEEGARKMGL